MWIIKIDQEIKSYSISMLKKKLQARNYYYYEDDDDIAYFDLP